MSFKETGRNGNGFLLKARLADFAMELREAIVGKDAMTSWKCNIWSLYLTKINEMSEADKHRSAVRKMVRDRA